MLKLSHFSGQSGSGPLAIPLFGPSDKEFEKVASASLMSDVSRYIETLRPSQTSIYVLVNAMGAGEYYGSNVNGDWFDESGLIHMPDDWSGNPLIDKAKAKDWQYGFPTFYNAHAFAHHRNKDATRAYGTVELSVWNPQMKRVELVVKVDKHRCEQFGGMSVWDKLKAGSYPDVSMGCLPSGSLITMADGTQKPIELVKETEWVLTHTGQRRRVTETMRRPHEGSVFRFNVYGFRRELVLTGNHPLWLVRGEQLQCSPVPSTINKGRKQHHCTPFVKAESKGCSECSVVPSYEFEWCRSDEAQIGDYLAFPLPQETNGDLDSSDLACFLGYYLAEGHVSNYNNRPQEQINFSLNYYEKEIAEEIERLARALGATVVWHHENPEAGARSVSVVSKWLAEKCLLWCGSGAKTKSLSKEVLYARPDLLLKFLGTYLNGDGGTYKGSAYFSTASEVLSHQLFIALARCGIIASVNKIDHKPSERSLVRRDTIEYQVWVGTDFSWKLGPYTLKPVRKSLKVRGQRFFYETKGVTYLMAPILEISEDDYKDDVFNFSVDGDNSYVAEGLAVHNSKVPFDMCAICTDWDLFRKALQYKSGNFKHPGLAVLAYHKTVKPIRGLSITRADYCVHAKTQMNRIYPDGRKVFVHNHFPRFFDISFVFIGADKTAKVMLFIYKGGQLYSAKPSAEVAEELGVKESSDNEKTASVSDELLKRAFGKAAKDKKSEIDKRVVPSQFAGKAIPLLTKNEPDIPARLQDLLADMPLEKSLATTTGMGVLLRPREFQRIVLIQLGKRDMADDLAASNKVFPKVDEEERVKFGPDDFMPALARLLAPLLAMRSALGPSVEQRVMVSEDKADIEKKATAEDTPLLRKISSAYNGYRRSVVDLVAHSSSLLPQVNELELNKLAEVPIEDLFTPLSVAYLKTAFLDEVPFGVTSGGVVQHSGETGIAPAWRGASPQ